MKKKLAIVGCGKLAGIVTDALLNGLLPDYQLIGVYSRTKEKADRLAEKVNKAHENSGCTVFDTTAALIAHQPDYIMESASPTAFKEFAIHALENSISIITLSIGALADQEFYKKVKQTAADHNAKIYITSGAIGGFDVLKTTTLMGGDTRVTFTTEKSPNSLQNTPVYTEDLHQEKREVFRGNAKEAIALFPTKVNVAVAASLASVGAEQIEVSINSIPDFIGDDHRIEIKNEQVHAIIDVYSKTSEIAGWSVVNTLRNIVSPIVF